METIKVAFWDLKEFVFSHWRGVVIVALALAVFFMGGLLISVNSKYAVLQVIQANGAKTMTVLLNRIVELDNQVVQKTTELASMRVEMALIPSVTEEAVTAAQPKVEPVMLVEPAPMQEIALVLQGCDSGTREIEFSRYLQAGEKVVGAVTWEKPFSTPWRFGIKGVGGTPQETPMKMWNVLEQTHSFEYVSGKAGEYFVRIINQQKGWEVHIGVMEISGEWIQTEF